MPVLYWQGYGFLGVGKNFIVNVDPIEFQDAEAMRFRAFGVLSFFGFGLFRVLRFWVQGSGLQFHP